MPDASFLPAILTLCLAYIVGSLPFAVIVSRLMGLSDPRQYGSGNPGATNVLRSGNKLAAALTLLGDALKGWVVVWLLKQYGDNWGLAPWVAAGAAAAVFLGHIFSIFLGFKGGKGVATAAGVLMAISPWLGLSTLGIWLMTVAVSRYSSLAALCAAFSAPFLTLYFTASWLWCAVSVVLALVLIWRHKENIRRLLNGTEGRVGKKA